MQNTSSSSGQNNKGFRGKVSWSGGFPDEPPLLEELGVDFSQIARRAKSAMNPLPSRKTRETSKDDDLAGPLVVFGLIATLHAIQGKMHYGYILGWSAIASGLTCWLLNQLTAQSNSKAVENLSLSRTASVIGYNATSILFLSFMKAFVYSQGSNSGSNNSSDGSPSGKNSFGILAFANEIYRFGDDLNEDGRVSQSEQLIYNDKTMKGRVFKEWKSFDHPTLGKVEIGGWKKFGQNNPLPEFLPREVDRNVDFMLMQARAMPLLEISDVEQTYLKNDNYRLTVTISNTGFQPTELAIRKNNNRAVPVRVNLSTANNVTILDEKQEKDAGHISGNGEAEVTWLIQGPRGGSVTINAYHPKGGRTVQTLKLKR